MAGKTKNQTGSPRGEQSGRVQALELNQLKRKFRWQWPTLACRNHILPSALAGLTAGFEMGPGVPPPLISPTKLPFIY